MDIHFSPDDTIRHGMGRRCCCAEDCTDVFKLNQCTGNTCPEDDVYVTCAALAWLKSQPGTTYVFCYSEYCCLIYLEGTTELQAYDELPEGGTLLDSQSAGQTGEQIQDFEQCDCVDCDVGEGACCYTFRGSTYCVVTDQENCYDTYEGKNPVYWGDDTCCYNPIDADCSDLDDDTNIECSDPDPPACSQFTGICVDNTTATHCGNGGDASGCATTYAITVTFPALASSSGTAGNTDSCADGNCDVPQNAVCCKDVLAGSTASGSLTKIPGKEKWTTGSEWIESPPLGGGFHLGAKCWQYECDDDGCHECYLQYYEDCWNGIPGWSCPCCAGDKHMKYRFSASISEVSSHNSQQGDNTWCGGAPCNTYAIRVNCELGTNGCQGDTACGNSCGGACPNDAICWHPGYTVLSYVGRPGCDCPAGLTSGNASSVCVVDNVIVTGKYCFHACGCEVWVEVSTDPPVRIICGDLLSQFIWSIA